MAQFLPETYGAVGNGVTDDTSAFASMGTAIAAAGGGEVILTGTYFLPNGWLLPSSNMQVDGRGKGKIKATVSGVSTYDAVMAVSRTNIVLQNFHVEVPLTNYRNGGFAMKFTACVNMTVDNVKTSGGTAGMWFVTCQRVTVRGCYVFKPKADGIHFGHASVDCIAVGSIVPILVSVLSNRHCFSHFSIRGAFV